jgi:Flp pilus assembly pilin Flp
METRLKRGQSILEYTLLLGAIIGVIVLVLLKQGGIKDKVEGAYNKTGETIGKVTDSMNQGLFGM